MENKIKLVTGEKGVVFSPCCINFPINFLNYFLYQTTDKK